MLRSSASTLMKAVNRVSWGMSLFTVVADSSISGRTLSSVRRMSDIVPTAVLTFWVAVVRLVGQAFGARGQLRHVTKQAVDGLNDFERLRAENIGRTVREPRHPLPDRIGIVGQRICCVVDARHARMQLIQRRAQRCEPGDATVHALLELIL